MSACVKLAPLKGLDVRGWLRLCNVSVSNRFIGSCAVLTQCLHKLVSLVEIVSSRMAMKSSSTRTFTDFLQNVFSVNGELEPALTSYLDGSLEA